MNDVPVFRMTVIAAYDVRDAVQEARDRGLRRSEWVYAGDGDQVRGHSPDCPLVVTEAFSRRSNAVEVAEELRWWKQTDAAPPVDAPTQPG